MKFLRLVVGVTPLLGLAAKLRTGRGTCDEWSCSQGYVPKKGAKALEGASDEECCLATCKLHPCADGFLTNPGNEKKIGSSDAECCTPTCGKAFDDGSFECGQDEKVSKPNIAGASAKDCCEVTCAAYNCTGQWFPHPSKMEVIGSSNEKCCVPLCIEVTCDPGFILDISKLEEGGTKEECCLKSCEFFKCDGPHGFGIPPLKLKQPANSSEDCCQPQCRSHVCSDGWSKDHSHDEAFEPSDETCCQMQCQRFQCPEGWVSNEAHKKEIGNTAEFCCLPPCTSYNCSAEDHLVAIDGAYGRTDESCCHKTCAAHQCSKGLVSVPSRAETFPSDDATCCEVAGCEKIRKLTKLQSGESCNTLSKDKCDSYFGSFINEKKRAILARCDFDRHFDLCRLSPSELDCVDL